MSFVFHNYIYEPFLKQMLLYVGHHLSLSSTDSTVIKLVVVVVT